MVKSKNIDMCSGPLFVKILKFAFPFMLTGIMQRLYNAADVVVVGRYAGQEALAGVGTTGSITSLVLNIFIGLSAGVAVVIGRALGAKDDEKVHKAVHTAILLCFICGIVVSIIGVVFADFLLKLIDVPADVLPQASIYMKIIFAGKVPALVYNFGAAILRAKGDTKRPLYIVSISGIINVLFNLFFVINLGMKADGVALATVISQIFTAVAILYILCKESDNTKLNFKKLRIYKEQFIDVVKIGLPSGLQSMTFSLSNVIIQSSVNSFGAAAIAGASAASNIGGFFSLSLSAFLQAAVVFVSQNMGAKKYDRINKIVKCCFIDVAFVWVIQVLIVFFLGEMLLGFYAPGNAEAIRMGLIRFRIVGGFFGLCGFVDVMSGTLRGMGRSFSSMLISVGVVCGIRIVWIFTVFKAIGTFQSLFWAYPVSWLCTFVLQFVFFMFAKRSLYKLDKVTE